MFQSYMAHSKDQQSERVKEDKELLKVFSDAKKDH